MDLVSYPARGERLGKYMMSDCCLFSQRGTPQKLWGWRHYNSVICFALFAVTVIQIGNSLSLSLTHTFEMITVNWELITKNELVFFYFFYDIE